MNLKEQKMKKEARERIVDCLKNYYDGHYSDLHHELFNSGYYIIGAERAKEALEEFGVWEAIKKVQAYERDTFGELYTNLGDPEKLVNMLFYIIGEEVLYEMINDSETLRESWNNFADEETNTKILEELGE